LHFAQNDPNSTRNKKTVTKEKWCKNMETGFQILPRYKVA
jgi:hypothetical protein